MVIAISCMFKISGSKLNLIILLERVCYLILINLSLLCFSLQVLTKDLEKHADELQAQEGLPVGATPIINMPHISARYWFISILFGV